MDLELFPVLAGIAGNISQNLFWPKLKKAKDIKCKLYLGEYKMANCCGNWVEVSGEKKDLKKFLKLVGKEFDFEKVIPTKTDTKDEADEKWGCPSIAFDTTLDGSPEDGQLCWQFWTKWCPPKLIYEKLVEMFPKVFISWRYEEPGQGLYGYLQNED